MKSTKHLGAIFLLLLMTQLHGQNFSWVLTTGGETSNANSTIESGRYSLNDASGNIINIGHFVGTADMDPSGATLNFTSVTTTDPTTYIAKYSSSKALIWAKKVDRLNSFDIRDACIGPDGSIYLAGLASSQLEFDASLGNSGKVNYSSTNYLQNYYVVKYNNSGVVQWVNNYPGVSKITVDAANNLYLFGTVIAPVDLDTRPATSTIITPTLSFADYIVKINSSLDFLYAKQIDRNNSSITDVSSIKTDNSSIYISGYYFGTVDLDPSAAINNLPIIPASATHYPFFASYNATNGDYKWGKALSSNGSMYSVSTVIDPSGNLFLTGISNATSIDFDPSAANVSLTANGGVNTFLAKYTAAGNYSWANYFSQVNGFGIALGNRNIYLHGQASKTIDLNPSAAQNFLPYSTDFIAAYSLTSGSLSWLNSIGGKDNVTNTIELIYHGNGSISVDPQENVYATGIMLHAPSATSDMDPGTGVLNVTVNGYPNDNYLAKYTPTTFDFTPATSYSCNKAFFTMAVSVNGQLLAGNQFTLQLSDANGSFAAPSYSGTFTFNTSSNIGMQIPANIPEGTGYKLRLTSSTSSLVVEKSFSIYAKPVVTISASNTNLCEGQSTTLTASISGSTLNQAIQWKRNGIAISGATQSTLLLTNVTASNAGTYVCDLTNICHDTSSNALALSIAPKATINGIALSCENATNRTYSTPFTAGSSYVWALPAGVNLVSGQASNSITVNFVNYTSSGQISLQETHASGCITTSFISIAAIPTPAAPAITGTASVCPNGGIKNYAANSAGTIFNWTYPNGSTPVGAIHSNTLSLNYTNFTTNDFITVREVSPEGCPGVLSTFPVTPLSAPVTSAITGPATVCDNVANVSYSVTATPGSSYLWSKPTASGFASGQGTASIKLSFNGSFVNQPVSVVETNSQGCSGAPVSLLITANASPAESIMTGSFVVCGNATGVAYSVPATVGSSYAWTVMPAGKGVVQSGQGSASVQIDFTGLLGYGSVSVTETNSANCSAFIASILVEGLSAPAAPIEIYGTTDVCGNASDQVYSVNYTPGASYIWTSPAGTTISNGTTDSPTIHFSNFTGAGIITAREVNTTTNCISAPASLIVNALPLPVTSAITGLASVCDNSKNVAYQVVGNGVSYTWTLPANVSFAGSTNTASILVDFSGSVSNGTLSVRETNAEGCTGEPASFTVNTIASPTTSGISGLTSVCGNAVGVSYSVNGSAGSHFVWSVPAGAAINGAVDGSSISVDYSGFTLSEAITVQETNVAGCAGNTNAILVDALPVPANPIVSGPSGICSNGGIVTYSVANTPFSSYTWATPVGSTITSGENSSTVSINFANFTANGSIAVSETNSSLCTSATTIFPVSVLTVPGTSVISGLTNVCDNASAVSYNVPATAGSSYTWAIPSVNATANGSLSGASISVNFTGNVSTQKISVTETNSAGCSTASEITLQTVSSPSKPVLQGSYYFNVCSNAKAAHYYTSGASGTVFNWTVPSGGQIISGNGSNMITVDFDNVQNGGIISVSASLNGCTSAAATQALNVYQAPDAPVFTGPAGLCDYSSTNYNYSISNPSFGNTYLWTVPNGVAYTSNVFGSIAARNMSFTGNGTISAKTRDQNGCISSEFTIPVSGILDAAVDAPVFFCVGNITKTLSVAYNPEATYNWQVDANHSILSGSTSNAITIALDYQNTVYGSVVVSTPNCTKTTNFQVFRSHPGFSPSIFGPQVLCENTTTATFTTLFMGQGAKPGIGYTWTLPLGMTFNTGINSNTIQVNTSAFSGTGSISVYETNEYGCSGSPTTITVKRASPPSAIIADNGTQLCQGVTKTFRTTNLQSLYTWTASPEITVNRGWVQNEITVVNNGSLKTTGFISVTETEGTCTKAPVSIAVTGVPTLSISGPSSVCRNSADEIFTVTSLPNTSYTWYVPAGALVTSGAGSNEIHVRYTNYNTGYVTVYSNTVGDCQGSASKLVTGVAAPTTSAIVGAGNVCVGMTNAVFSVTSTPLSTYNWIAPAGAMIASGNGSNSVTLTITDPTVISDYIYVTERNSTGCYGTQMKKFISSSADFTGSIIGPTKVCPDAREVLYGVTETINSSYTWTLPNGATIITPTSSTAVPNGPNKNAIYTNFAGFSTGTISVQEKNSVGCLGIPKSLNIGNLSSSYAMPSINIACNNPATIDLPLSTTNPISSDVVGLSICFSYNPAVITPITTGTKYILGSVVTSGGTATVTYTTTTPGEIRANIYYNNATSRMSGSGNIITFKFKVAANAAVGSSSPITFCGLTEGYGSGGNSAQCITTNAVVSLIPNEMNHKGSLKLLASPGAATTLGYDSETPSRFLITNISGSTNAACGGVSSSFTPDVNGKFTYNTSNGDFLQISRDIAPTQDVSGYVNSQDAKAVDILTTTGYSSRVSMNDLLAADVDMNGYINTADIDLILLRSTLKIPSFPQMISPSRDWIYLDSTSLTTPLYNPAYFLTLAASKYYLNPTTPLPVVSPCLPIRKVSSGTCSYVPNETYYGILMGDLMVAPSLDDNNNAIPRLYQSLPNSHVRTTGSASTSPEILIDLTSAEKLQNGNLKVPVYFTLFDSAASIDLNFDYDQSKLSVISCSKTNVGENANVIYASNNWNNDKFYISGYTQDYFEAGTAIYFLEIDPVTESPSKNDFGVIKGMLNGFQVNARVLEKGIATDVTEAEFSNVSVYPNPTLDKLNLVGIEGNFQVSILNVQGEEIFAASNITQINVSDFTAGMYHLKLSSANGSKVIKFNKL